MNTSPSGPRSTDRIEREIALRAPPARVWRALTDAEEFGNWFCAKFESPFAVGAHVRGRITYPGYDHLTMEIAIERMDAERLFSFRWHPYAVDPAVDYSSEPLTLVEFRLEATGTGTLLRVSESGFDRIPAARRAEAFLRNSQGWQEQMENVRRHVDG
jgi:uncharacterized protein YndB with AHSA1/START domain